MYSKQQFLSAADKTGINNIVTWGYHVAPVVWVHIYGKYVTYVIDPAIADKPLTTEEWLNEQNQKKSFYLFTNSEWLNFVNISGKIFKYEEINDEGKIVKRSVNIPGSFPPLFTGDFIKNDGLSLNDKWVEKGLALNTISMKIIDEIIKNPSVPRDVRTIYTKLVTTNIGELEENLNSGEAPSGVKLMQFKSLSSEFIRVRDQWKKVLDKYR